MSVVSQRPHRQYMVLQWGHVALQEYANGSFVSNNNILTILFFNTYYHKQINKILIAAFNETFRQSSDPVYAHTPMRNVGELRTFNPNLRTSPEAKSIKCRAENHVIPTHHMTHSKCRRPPGQWGLATTLRWAMSLYFKVRKIYSVFKWKLIVGSGHNISYYTTAQLSVHVRNHDLICDKKMYITTNVLQDYD